MCWSPIATACFSALHIIAICIIIYRRRELWDVIALCLVIYATMEIFQFIQWNWGHVGTCDRTNRMFTLVGIFLVIIQPAWLSGIGWYLYGWAKWALQTGLLASVVIIYMIILIYHSEGTPTTHPIHADFLTWDTNVANIICTVVGPNGHMVWKIAMGLVHPDFQLNHTFYLLGMLMVFAGFDRKMIFVPIAWTLSLGISLVAVWGSIAELPSFWCMFSVIASVFVYTNVAWEWYYQYAFQPRSATILDLEQGTPNRSRQKRLN